MKFGKIKFAGLKGSKRLKKYVIVPPVPSEEEMDALYNTFMKECDMKPPNIIISVTGGAESFKIRTSLKKEFQKSLIKAAVKTGGWIVSGGTHSGVMKYVGDAVHAHSTVDSKEVIAIGITTLGTLKDGGKLSESNGEEPVTCRSLNNLTLNENHSHFVLVDDDKVGGEISLRVKLERLIVSKLHKEKQKNLPIVSILLQGDPSSLRTIWSALKEETPVVVIGDSGGWANILTSIYGETYNSVNENMISELLSEESIIYKASELSEWTKMARECIMHKKLITIFSLRDYKSAADLDIAILQAILSANTASTGESTKTHLELALAWNRSDIASSDILTGDVEIESDILQCLYVEALKEDKFAFVELFLEHGYDFLSHFPERYFLDLYDFGKNENSTVKYLMEYLNDSNSTDCCTKFLQWMRLPSDFKIIKDEQEVLRRLFQWAVILNRSKIAKIFWNAMSEEEFPAAVVAHRLLMRMAKKSKHKDENRDYIKHAETYKELELGILTKCYENDSKQAVLSLTRKLKNWGGITCLELAVKSNDYNFVAHQAVQLHLDRVWLGGIVDNGKQSGWWSLWFWFKLILYAFVPLFVMFDVNYIEFEDKTVCDTGNSQSIQNGGANASSRNQGSSSGETTCFIEVSQPPPNTNQSHANRNQQNCWNTFFKESCQRLKTFYTAPIVKFFWNVFFYVVFLFLFAYFLLFNLFPHVHNGSRIPEYLLVCWVFILAADEVRQIFNAKNKKIHHKIWKWIVQTDNIFDLTGFVFFVLGYSLRFTQLHEAKILLVISFVVYSLGILSMFKVNQDLGPKLLMVGRMLKDLVFFIFIWLVFLFAYGVASQSLLYPNEPRVGVSITNVFYKPYWQLYGELFLSEINYNPSTDELKCTNDVENLNTTGLPRCPNESSIVPIMSAGYMLLVNVLLLNLLIAMFSYTFEDLVKKTSDIWRFQRLALIKEYYHRPWLVVPFSIFYYFYYLYCFMRKTFCKERKAETILQKEAFEQTLSEDTRQSHECWEHLQTESYLEEQRLEKNDVLLNRLDDISNALHCLKKCQTDIQRKLALNFRKKQSKPVHIKSRKSPYFKTDLNRFKVEDHMVPWTVPFDQYKATEHTAEDILTEPKPVWADPPDNPDLPYNQFDTASKVDRTSYLGRYMVVEKVVRNPIGRTGLAGRGALGRYGPNHTAYWIVSRWKKVGENIMMKQDKPVLEFIAIKRKDTLEWAIPGGMVHAGEHISNTWVRDFMKELLGLAAEATDHFLKYAGTEVFRGYSDDYRNTDNAWIEAFVSNFHDECGSFLSDDRVKNANGVRWVNIDKEEEDCNGDDQEEKDCNEKDKEEASWVEIGKEGLDLFADHEKFVKKVARLRKAYYSKPSLSID